MTKGALFIVVLIWCLVALGGEDTATSEPEEAFQTSLVEAAEVPITPDVAASALDAYADPEIDKTIDLLIEAVARRHGPARAQAIRVASQEAREQAATSLSGELLEAQLAEEAAKAEAAELAAIQAAELAAKVREAK